MVRPLRVNQFWTNPLEPAVRALNIDHVCADAGPRLFVAATNVHTGKVRVFGDDILAPLDQAAADIAPSRPTANATTSIGQSRALHPLYATDRPEDIVIGQMDCLSPERSVPEISGILNGVNEITSMPRWCTTSDRLPLSSGATTIRPVARER